MLPAMMGATAVLSKQVVFSGACDVGVSSSVMVVGMASDVFLRIRIQFIRFIIHFPVAKAGVVLLLALSASEFRCTLGDPMVQCQFSMWPPQIIPPRSQVTLIIREGSNVCFVKGLILHTIVM